MPGAPHPTNLTQRIWLTYTSRGLPHEIEFRPTGSQTQGTLESMAAALANGLRLYMFTDDTVSRAEYAGIGSNVRFPLLFTPVGGVNTLAGNIWPSDPESTQLSLTGKGELSGWRWSSRFFTAFTFLGLQWPSKNRWNFPSGFPGVDALFDLYSTWYGPAGAAGVRLVGIGSQNIILNGYVNICSNGYWQRRQRRG